MATITATMGVWIASCGMIGYLMHPLGGIPRVLLFAAGIMLLLPAGAFSFGLILDIAGFGIGALVIGYERLSMRRAGTAG